MQMIWRVAVACGLSAAAMVPVAANASTGTKNHTYKLGDLSTDPAAGAINVAIPKVGSTTATSFTDKFTFTLDAGSASTLYYANLVTTLGKGFASNVTNAAISLFDSTTGKAVYQSSLSSTVGNTSQLALLGGNYIATITGLANGTGSTLNGQSIRGNYTFSVTAPAPEPAAWVSLILGIGMAGFSVRRKKAPFKAHAAAI